MVKRLSGFLVNDHFEKNMETTTKASITAISAKKIGQVAVACIDNTITIYYDEKLTPITVYKLKQPITCLDYSSQGPSGVLAAGTSDGNIFLFPGSSGNPIPIGNPQKSSIQAISFDDTGNRIAAASIDGTVAIYTRKSPSDSQWTNTIFTGCHLGCTAVAWGAPHPLMKALTLFVGGMDGVLRVFTYSLESSTEWKNVASVQAFNTFVKKIAFPSTVASSLAQKIGACSQNGEVVIAKYIDMKLSIQKVDVSKPATGVAWTMGEQTLVVSHADGSASYVH